MKSVTRPVQNKDVSHQFEQHGARRKPRSPCRNGGTQTVANFTSRRGNKPEGGRDQRRSVGLVTVRYKIIPKNKTHLTLEINSDEVK